MDVIVDAALGRVGRGTGTYRDEVDIRNFIAWLEQRIAYYEQLISGPGQGYVVFLPDGGQEKQEAAA